MKNNLLKSYFYWTYSRGSFHYDVMVTLILAFIFITPHLWNYGDKPPAIGGPAQPIQVQGDGVKGLILTVPASEVVMPAEVTNFNMRRALKRAMQPVTGDAVTISHWELTRDDSGNPVAWKVWAHH
jgi:hypothetical protein